jgi:6,7-dimethyl-8-ribityllumazine synthase
MKINQNISHFDNMSSARIAIVMSKYNDSLGNQLKENVEKTLIKNHVPATNIQTFLVYRPRT